MLRKITTILEWTIFAGLCALLFVVGSPLLGRQAFVNTFAVSSGSMEPNIPTGALAISQPVETSEIQTGDVIAFTSPYNAEITVIHRVESVSTIGDQPSFITKGDNNNAPDNWQVGGSLVKGKVINHVPYLGSLVMGLRTTWGFVLGVGIPALFLAILQLKKIKEGISEEIERRTRMEVAQKLLEQGKATAMAKTLSVALLLPALLFAAPKVSALFSSTVTIEGGTLRTAAAEPEPDCEVSEDGEKAGFSIVNAENLHVRYVMKYESKKDKWDAFEGEFDTSVFEDHKIVSDFILGTCSDGVCTHPEEIGDVILNIVMKMQDGRTVEDEIICNEE